MKAGLIMNMGVLFILIAMVPLTMFFCLFITRKKAGKSLIKLWNLDTILFFILGLTCVALLLFALCFEKDTRLILFLLLVSLYSFSHSWIISNSIAENGIVICDNLPYLLKWNEIQRFKFQGNRIFFEKEIGYASIVVFSKNLEALEKIIFNNIRNAAGGGST
jgi:hypothetical protein